MRAGWLVECGRLPYGDAWALQRALLAARQADQIADTLLLLEHPPVITIGRAGHAANILIPREALAARGFEVFEIERGRGCDISWARSTPRLPDLESAGA